MQYIPYVLSDFQVPKEVKRKGLKGSPQKTTP